MNIVAIIPARGGSKGIPRKNLRLLGGVPLIGWSIHQAKSCSRINEVYVSTDDDEIANMARAFGAKVPFMRPMHLASDSTATVEVVDDFLRRLSQESACPDFVVLLQPTQPFRTLQTIYNSIDLAIKINSGVVTLSQVNEHPVLMRRYRQKDSSVEKILPGIDSTIRRQDFPAIYRVNGAVYVNPVRDYFFHNSLNDNPYAVLTDKIEAVDIDEQEDLLYAEWLIERGLVAPPQVK